MQLQQKGGGAENKNGFGDEMSTSRRAKFLGGNYISLYAHHYCFCIVATFLS